jgi:hypothetical protein
MSQDGVMRYRQVTLQMFDSVEEADEANRIANRKLTGIERVRMLTAIIGGGHARSQSRLSGSYRFIDVPRR